MKECTFCTRLQVRDVDRAFTVNGWVDGEIGYYLNQVDGSDRWFGIDLNTGFAAHAGFGSSLDDIVRRVADNWSPGQYGVERIGYGPTEIMNPKAEVVAQVPLMTVGMITADIPVGS